AEDWGIGSEEDVGEIVRAAVLVLDLSCKPDVQGRISFNDMVWLPVRLNLVRPWFDLVVIDEAQDMNALQLAMARGACKRNGRVCVVGDDRQAIYGFRGADAGGMDRMAEELGAVELGLCKTFRCPKRVVEAAAHFVPDYVAAEGNAEGVVECIMKERMLSMLDPGDAVLSRANAPLMPLCLNLLRNGVPAMIEGRDVGKQLAGIVKKLRARSVPDLMRKLQAWKKRMAVRLASRDDAESKIAVVEDQADAIQAIAEGARSVGEIDERLVDLFKDSEKEKRPMVVLSSVHKAKGLEWDRVFMLQDTFGKRSDIEEKNIEYVAITRAKRELYSVLC
ncbi:MAG: UvrD-helicase domain-containing protein, partial [Planctomycetota bacterium]